MGITDSTVFMFTGVLFIDINQVAEAPVKEAVEKAPVQEAASRRQPTIMACTKFFFGE